MLFIILVEEVLIKGVEDIDPQIDTDKQYILYLVAIILLVSKCQNRNAIILEITSHLSLQTCQQY